MGGRTEVKAQWCGRVDFRQRVQLGKARVTDGLYFAWGDGFAEEGSQPEAGVPALAWLSGGTAFGASDAHAAVCAPWTEAIMFPCGGVLAPAVVAWFFNGILDPCCGSTIICPLGTCSTRPASCELARFKAEPREDPALT